MVKRFLTLALATVMAAGLLSGCSLKPGGGGSDDAASAEEGGEKSMYTGWDLSTLIMRITAATRPCRNSWIMCRAMNLLNP